MTRVRLPLAHRGIDHEGIGVPPSAVRPDGFVLPPEFIKHSPRLEIPLVRTGGDHLVDSVAILKWLEQRVDAPSFLPAGEQTPQWLAHGERCRRLDGWQAVACTSEHTEEFVSRFPARHRCHAEKVS